MQVLRDLWGWPGIGLQAKSGLIYDIAWDPDVNCDKTGTIRGRKFCLFVFGGIAGRGKWVRKGYGGL